MELLLTELAYKLTRLEAWARRIDPEGFDAADADTTCRVLRFGARQRLDDVGLDGRESNHDVTFSEDWGE